MRGELTLAPCLLPPISPIKNILPSRSARSSPGPQLYFINTFRHVQKGMIHAGPERCETRGRLSAFTGQASCAGPGLALRGYHLSAPGRGITWPQLEGLTHTATFRHPQRSPSHRKLLEGQDATHPPSLEDSLGASPLLPLAPPLLPSLCRLRFSIASKFEFLSFTHS